jgi:hypothetical protein
MWDPAQRLAGISGRLARKYRWNTSVRAGWLRTRTHDGMSLPDGAITRRDANQRPCAEPRRVCVTSGWFDARDGGAQIS